MRVIALPLSLSLLVLACGDDGKSIDTAETGTATDGAESSTNGETTDNPTTAGPGGDPGGDPTTETPPGCGDGNLDADEECDAGAANRDDGECTTACKKANCGDGLVHAGVEECDDANVDYSDACVANCRNAKCGDGFLGQGEGCDDGNDIDDDECSNSCATGDCGNGDLDVGEQCDDGNANPNDACLNTCQMATCGDQVVWTGTEECDDGNNVDDDRCSNACTVGQMMMPGCDDGMLNGDETDVDCGGSCSPCADGQKCDAGTDCEGGNCSGGVCEPGNNVVLDAVDCAPAMVNVDMAFAGAIMGNCGCHGGGSGGLKFNDAASFKAATVNVDSSGADMKRITPGNINESYVLYKLHGQQGKVPGGGGALMPQGGNQLPDDKMCLMINWVKSI